MFWACVPAKRQQLLHCVVTNYRYRGQSQIGDQPMGPQLGLDLTLWVPRAYIWLHILFTVGPFVFGVPSTVLGGSPQEQPASAHLARGFVWGWMPNFLTELRDPLTNWTLPYHASIWLETIFDNSEEFLAVALLSQRRGQPWSCSVVCTYLGLGVSIP